MCCIRRIGIVSGVVVAVLLMSLALAGSALAEYQTFDVQLTAKERIQLAIYELQDALNAGSSMAVENLKAVAEDVTREDLTAAFESVTSAKGLAEARAVFNLEPVDYREMGDGYSVGVKVMLRTGAGIIADTVTLNVRGDSTQISLLGLAKTIGEVAAFLSEEATQEYLTAGADNVDKSSGPLEVPDYTSPNLLRPVNLYGDIGRLSVTTSKQNFNGASIFNRPYGLLSFSYHDPVGSYSFLIVTDANWDRVIVAEPDKQWLHAVGHTGTAPGNFRQPAGIAWAKWKFYVADSYNNRVTVFRVNTAPETPEITYDTSYQDDFDAPIDVAADVFRSSDGWPYRYFAVLDQGNKRVRVYGWQLDHNGMLFPNTTTDFALVQPTAIAFGRSPIQHTPTQLCYVANNGNTWHPTGIIGFYTQKPFPQPAAAFGTAADIFPADAYLTSVCCDNYGYVYAVDSYNSVVYKFTAGLELVGKFGSRGTGAGQLYYPVRMTIPRHQYVPYEEPEYYGDMGDAVITEMFGANSGIRRFVQGFDILAHDASYIPRYADYSEDFVSCRWFQSGYTRSNLKLYKLRTPLSDSLIWQSGWQLTPTGERTLSWSIPATMPDSCNIVASLTAKSMYQSSYQVTVCDTLRFRRYTAPIPNPCGCPVGLSSFQILDPASDFQPVSYVYTNPNKIWKLRSQSNLLCEGISVGPYEWSSWCNCSGWPTVQFGLPDSTGEMQWSDQWTRTPESEVWVRFQYNFTYAHLPVPGDTNMHIRLRAHYPGDGTPHYPYRVGSPDDSLARGPADTCGVKHKRFTVYWSRCQSPSADSTCTDCCTGRSVGDLDSDGLVTMGDLTILIDHLFITLQPLACPTSGNTDWSSDGLVTMGDMTVLVDFLYVTETPLPPCPY